MLAVGNPLGLRSSVTSGIVSVPGRAVAERGGAAGLDAALAALRPGKTVNVQLVQANGARAAVDAKLGE